MTNNLNPGFISIVIPVYNSQDTIAEVCHILQKKMNDMQWNYEIILVDDHSNAETKKATETLKNEFKENIHVIRLSKNFGQNSATLCGIAQAKGDLVITLDDDLDYRPEEVVCLVQTFVGSEADVIYGFQKKSSVIRKWGRNVVSYFLHQSDGSYSTLGSSFRIMNKNLAEKIKIHAQDHAFINQIISWYTSDIAYFEIKAVASGNSNSGYSLFHLIQIALRLIFFYSSFPLKMIMAFSFISAMISFIAGSYYLLVKLSKGAPLGYTSTIVSVLFGVSIILFSIGVLATFINRIYDTRIKKPTYSVKHKS